MKSMNGVYNRGYRSLFKLNGGIYKKFYVGFFVNENAFVEIEECLIGSYHSSLKIPERHENSFVR